MLLPLPRFRIYTKPWMYGTIAKDILLGKTKTGDAHRRLEERVMQKTGASYAVCMPKNRVGIFLVIRALIKPGQKVILSPLTISDIINMVICAGGVPVFADIRRETINIDPDEVEKLIDNNTGAVLVTHLHGYACDMDRIVQICKNRGVPLVEDAAQAFGTLYRSKMTGTLGDAGVYSFGMYKNVNSFFGGMVVTPHQWLHDRLRNEVATFPFQEIDYYLSKAFSGLSTDVATYPLLFKLFTYWIFRFGYLHNIKMLMSQITVDMDPKMKQVLPESYLRRLTPMQAELALPQIDKVDRDSDARIWFARMYYNGLKDLKDLVIAPFHDDRSHTYIYYPIQVPDRHALIRYMMTRGCDISASHYKNCADLEAFRTFYRDCPNARATANTLLYLPTYPRYSEEQGIRNIKVIREFFFR